MEIDDDFDDIEDEDAVAPSLIQGKIPVPTAVQHQSTLHSNINSQAKASRTSGEELRFKTQTSV